MSGFVSSLLGSVSNVAADLTDATVGTLSGKVADVTDSILSNVGYGKIDKFKKGKRIGNGASGIVYLCTDSEGNEYAWKELPITKKTTINDLSYEYKIVEKLGGWPNTLQYVEAGKRTYTMTDNSKEEYMIFISGLILGYDLEKIIYSDAKITPEQIKWIMAQLLYGLSGLSENKIGHFDIKPSNIMITDEFDLTIIDFGTAYPIYNESSRRTIKPKTIAKKAKFVATFPYLNKDGIEKYIENQTEQVDLSEEDMKNDVWAAGCVLYELWKRNFLFKSIDEADHINKLDQFKTDILENENPENKFAEDPKNPTDDEKEVFEFFLFLMKNTGDINAILEHDYIIDYVDYNKKKHNHPPPPKAKDGNGNGNDNDNGSDGLDVD